MTCPSLGAREICVDGRAVPIHGSTAVYPACNFGSMDSERRETRDWPTGSQSDLESGVRLYRDVAQVDRAVVS
jgi:hypothetical protein